MWAILNGDVTKMAKKILKFKAMLIAVFFCLCGCATETFEINGIDGSPIPPAFANFPDIPFPEQAYMELGDTKALGSGDNWIGSVVYTAPYNASRVFDFYVSEMPKNRWIEVAVVRARISQMTYYRDNRAVQILIESTSDNESLVTITAIPNQLNIK